MIGSFDYIQQLDVNKQQIKKYKEGKQWTNLNQEKLFKPILGHLSP